MDAYKWDNRVRFVVRHMYDTDNNGYLDINDFESLALVSDGIVTLEEFRMDCVNRSAFQDIQEIDDSYNKLLNENDKKNGGITQARYQELYAEFIGSPETEVPGAHLFGPLTVY
ncbi:Sarcoplasmic calcium-binding protein 1 like protein [Argiope bruennichi]|uniref:Sarcoplasmic calcium-binding protein 1 like protein n=1 Tax=Argiope bruennichi TaxID=94029 RepID=A0A8T0FAZ1_ARGBR|nr:Sarcoplasmic calcium-binding protein 1 like protein [Argiope bruennichi]